MQTSSICISIIHKTAAEFNDLIGDLCYIMKHYFEILRFRGINLLYFSRETAGFFRKLLDLHSVFPVQIPPKCRPADSELPGGRALVSVFFLDDPVDDV